MRLKRLRFRVTACRPRSEIPLAPSKHKALAYENGSHYTCGFGLGRFSSDPSISGGFAGPIFALEK
jgi:hypothetical protein